MKKVNFAIQVIFLIALITACAPQSSIYDPNITIQKANAIIAQKAGTSEGYRQAIQVISNELESRPNESSLFIARSNYLVSIGHYEDAKSDLIKASQIRTLVPEELMMKCMLTERTAGLTKSARLCYDNVVATYAHDRIDGAPPSSNYVFAALMANKPKANWLRKQFLKEKDHPKAVGALLTNFNRKRFIQSALP